MFFLKKSKDRMLYAVMIAPALTDCVFFFGVPYVESCSAVILAKGILAGNYLMFDLFLAVMTPYMFCFALSMVMLTERDENMAGWP